MMTLRGSRCERHSLNLRDTMCACRQRARGVKLVASHPFDAVIAKRLQKDEPTPTAGLRDPAVTYDDEGQPEGLGFHDF